MAVDLASVDAADGGDGDGGAAGAASVAVAELAIAALVLIVGGRAVGAADAAAAAAAAADEAPGTVTCYVYSTSRVGCSCVSDAASCFNVTGTYRPFLYVHRGGAHPFAASGVVLFGVSVPCHAIAASTPVLHRSTVATYARKGQRVP